MTHAWLSYVPHYLAHQLVEHPATSFIGAEARFPAIALFADVSGFTAISEALAASGRHGAEELTAILNAYFAPMIELIESYGGIVGKFGGDAMTVIFPAENAPEAAHRAVQCALAMQAEMDRYVAIPTLVGSYSLMMKAGIAAGTILCTTVGDPTLRLEYIIAGEALDRCADAEHHAQKGQVVVHTAILPLVAGIETLDLRHGERRRGCDRRVLRDRRIAQYLWEGAERRAGRERRTGHERRANDDRRSPHPPSYIRVANVTPPAPFAPLPALGAVTPLALERLRPFIHPAIAHRLAEGQQSLINEHRNVTVLFVAFSGFDYDHDPHVATQLQAYLAQVIHTIHHYDGFLNKVDMGDKGSKYIVLFGAPVAHEDDVERALRCALDLIALKPAATRIGINSGFVFSGQVGSERRQEYTVIGDAVNLAARLMQAALPGLIMVGDTTYRVAGESFAWDEHLQLRVKGKAAQIRAHRLAGQQLPTSVFIDPLYDLPMVGRQAELALAQERIALILQGHGQIVGVTGEAGMGKSRLVTEVLRSARRQGIEVVRGECRSFGRASSYLVWGELLTHLFAIAPGWSPEQTIRQLEQQLARADSRLVPRLPLLSSVLNIPIPTNAVTRSLDARMQKAALETLILDYLRRRARKGPLLLVLEDCQWIDPVSRDLLAVIGRGIAQLPILLIVVYRPHDRTTEGGDTALPVQHLRHFREIRLGECSFEETEELIRLKLTQLFGFSDIPPEKLIERINERAQGNPFYVEEMINLIADRGLDPTDIATIVQLDLPNSLHNLITSRIDQLAEQEQTTLKIASVIGRQFRAAWLSGIYPQVGDMSRVNASLEQLCSLGLTQLERPAPELEYLFRHIVTREVAYDSLALATRALLHAQTGRYIEQHYPTQISQFLDLLAYHYGLSNNHERQRHYFQLAGSAAQASYANVAAISYFERLLQLLEESERPAVLLRLGKMYLLLGCWGDAETVYRQALQITHTTNDEPNRAAAQRMMGELCWTRGAYSEAMEWLEQAHRGYQTTENLSGLGEAEQQIGLVYWMQGNYAPALERLERAQRIAEQTGDRQALNQVFNNLGLVYQNQGDYARALDSFSRCHRIADELGDALRSGIAVGNIGNIHLLRGDYAQAMDCYVRYLRAAQAVGYRLAIGIAVGNIGNIYEQQGEYQAARACYLNTLQMALDLGDRPGVVIALWSLATTAMAQQQYAEAESLLLRAIAIGRLIDVPYDLCACLQTLAELALLQRHEVAAHDLSREALPMAEETENHEVALRARLHLLQLSARLGVRTTIEAHEAIGALASDDASEEERAAIAYATWQVLPTDNDARVRAATLYARIYERIPSVHYRQLHHELTGLALPRPLALPPPPALIADVPTSIADLLLGADALIEELRNP